MRGLAQHLSQAFAMVDASVAAAIMATPPTCGRGCCACCRQPIPLTPLELLAIMEHVRLVWTPQKRRVFLESMGKTQDLPVQKRDCPFLLRNSCAIYQFRPLACRRFLVAGSPCSAGENPVDSRPWDIIVPDRMALEAALLSIYAWHVENAARYGLPKPPPPTAARAEQLAWLTSLTTIIQAADWRRILAG